MSKRARRRKLDTAKTHLKAFCRAFANPNKNKKKEETMRSKSYMLPASVAFLVLGTASSLVAQEVQEVSTKSMSKLPTLMCARRARRCLPIPAVSGPRPRCQGSSRDLEMSHRSPRCILRLTTGAGSWPKKGRVSQPCSRRVYLHSGPCRSSAPIRASRALRPSLGGAGLGLRIRPGAARPGNVYRRECGAGGD
jgi:hypothetical protein